MRTLITFSGERYHDTTACIVGDGPKLGADRVLVYDDVWLAEHPFRKVNDWLFQHPGDKNGKRGADCWYAFKPLVILDALDHAAPGDVVLYLDADTVPVADFSVIYEIAARDGGMFFKSQTHSQHRWCTRQCLFVMGQDERRYQFADAGCARFLAVRKGDWRARQLVMEWLTYAVNPYATTFDPPRSMTGRATLSDYSGSGGTWINMTLDEHDEFEEHRTEQAILTNLCHKHGFKLWREADQSGEESPDDRDVYGRLFTQIQQGSCQNGPGSRFRNV
jgi:hypothetical protein